MRFETAVNDTVTFLLIKAATPWFDECFEKYGEYVFHMRMSEGFSFIKDFRDNHSGGFGPDGRHKKDSKYLQFMHVARNLYRKCHISLDEDKVLDSIVTRLRGSGWTLYNEEIEKMRGELLQLRLEIES